MAKLWNSHLALGALIIFISALTSEGALFAFKKHGKIA
jgi:hypothetical protein